MEPRRRFRFLKELAAGGFGKVYLAEMLTGENFSSVVAIKLLHGRWLGNDEIVMRSRDEARLLGKLRHRNIVRVEDLTSINGQCAIVMEYLQGADLKTTTAWLKEQQRVFPRQAAFEVIAAVADALDAAYNARPLQGGEPLRVIHRDIKPSNVMITVEGDVKVLDFGTARASFEEREAKTQALAFGSAAYMAPERHLGEDDNVSADVFSLGVTAFEMLTLEPYGKIQVRPEKYEVQIEERLGMVELRGLTPGTRADALDLLRRMLAYEMSGRPTAAAVREGMEALAESTRDLPLRRLARESIASIADSMAVPIDPADGLAGAVVHEDASNIGQVSAGETASLLRSLGERSALAGDPTVEELSPVRKVAPPPPFGLATVRPADVPRPGSSAPRPTAGPPAIGAPAASAPPATGRVRPSNIQLGVGATIVGFDDAEPTNIAVGAARPAPRPEARGEHRASAPAVSPPSVLSTPTLAASDRRAWTEEEPRPAPPVSNLLVKLGVVAVGLVGLVGLVAIGSWLYYSAPDAPPRPTAPAVAEASSAGLVAGTAQPDWSPELPGRGGVILSVADGASEVEITNATGYRTAWNGQQFLRLRDLAPGVYRTKVRPTGGGSSLRADFSVDAGRICGLRFVSAGGGRWEAGECR